MNEELIHKLKYLKFSGLLANWENYLELAKQKDLSSVKLLTHIIDEEYRIKQKNARQFRMRCAKIPELYRMETFPFDKQVNLNKKKIHLLYDAYDYVTQHRNIIWIGPTGAGKTGLATAFLIQAVEKGARGRFITFVELIEQLYRSVGDHSEAKIIKTFAAYDILVIDELGYVEVEPVQVGLFFTLMQKRHRNKTTLITSNLGFQQWTTFLKNDHLTAALIDRLTENSHVINMKKCVSLRPKLNSD